LEKEKQQREEAESKRRELEEQLARYEQEMENARRGCNLTLYVLVHSVVYAVCKCASLSGYIDELM